MSRKGFPCKQPVFKMSVMGQSVIGSAFEKSTHAWVEVIGESFDVSGDLLESVHSKGGG